jgi:arylsulfatase A-like enzyme
LAYLDDQLARLFGELQRRRLLDNTIVIFTSDHGEAFGNHNLFGHGNSLYLETLHIPLFFHWPGRIPARRISKIVGLSQLPATVMDLLNRSTRVFPGESLAALWNGKEAGQASGPVYSDLRPGRFKDGPGFYPNSREGWSSLVTDRWHLLVSDSGRTELYAWREDPGENHDLAADPANREVIKKLRQQLPAISTTHNASSISS